MVSKDSVPWHICRMGAPDGYRLAVAEFVATIKGSSEVWWRKVRDRMGIGNGRDA